MTWVLARGDAGSEEYWTGRIRCGEPQVTAFTADAQKFHDAVSANECANTHPALWNSPDWRPVKLRARCERLA